MKVPGIYEFAVKCKDVTDFKWLYKFSSGLTENFFKWWWNETFIEDIESHNSYCQHANSCLREGGLSSREGALCYIAYTCGWMSIWKRYWCGL